MFLLASVISPCVLALGASPALVLPALRSPVVMMAASPATVEAGGGGVVLLSGHDLSLTYDGQRDLFSGISVSLTRGAKLALVGANGAGKSSLMRVLGGIERPNGGSVELGKNMRVAYVEQEPSLPEGSLADEFLFSSSAPAVVALREYRLAAAAAESAASDDIDAISARLGRASAAMDSTGGWAIESEMQRLCSSLSVEHLLARDAASLSGGQRKRIALAAALLQEPELLLLDEPTNHLDIEAIEWLEREMRGRKEMTALIVTHDRAFLSAACEEVLELDRSELHRHRGTYEDFLEAKQARLETEGQHAQAARNKLRAELQWVQRQPKARSTKSKSRLDAYETLSKKVKKFTSREAATKGALTLDADAQRLGSAIVRFVGASVDALSGAAVLRDFSYDFGRGDRVGVVGPNGVGKSTLLRALKGELPVVGGNIETGETVRFGHYEQQGLVDWPDETRVLAFVREAVARSPGGGQSGEQDERKASQLLSQFMFPPSRWGERVGQLSGGERRRLQLLSVLASQPNFLLLDEPTNDLDLPSIAALEDFLLSYAGVLVVVSHDRYFLDKICSHHFVLDESGSGEVLDWQGTFSEYLQYRDAKTAADAARAAQAIGRSSRQAVAKGTEMEEKQQVEAGDVPATASAAADGSGARMKPLSDFEIRVMEKLEAELDGLNGERDALQKKVDGFDSARNGYTELTEWTEAIDELGSKIDEVEEKWLALAERA